MRNSNRTRALTTTIVAACLMTFGTEILVAQVGPNDVALGKSAFQSSTLFPFTGAAKAVDGNTNGSPFGGSVSQTNEDIEGWWYVDLGGNYDISSITLWNASQASFRLQRFWVSVLASGTPNVSQLGAPTVWQQYTLGPVGTSAQYTPPSGTIGQYVKVQYEANRADYLSLAEVDVEGVGITTSPEPASLLLVATGLIGAALFMRRQRIAR